MRLDLALTIARKELREILRDRRTLLLMIGLPVLVYPLMMIGFSKLQESQTDAQEARQSDVALWGTQRLTDNDWWVFLKNPPKKACFLQTREGLSEKFATMDNSDHSRDTDEEYIQWKWRGTAGIALPYGVCKIDN